MTGSAPAVFLALGLLWVEVCSRLQLRAPLQLASRVPGDLDLRGGPAAQQRAPLRPTGHVRLNLGLTDSYVLTVRCEL